MLLTRAAGREACSPGRVGLVLIQFICRCVQHHQEKKSGPQRHRPLNTGYTTKQKETPPAVCVIHKNDAPRNKLLQRPEMERIQAVTSGLPAISCSFFLIYFSSTYIFFLKNFYYFLYLRPLTILSTCIDRLDRCEVRMRLYGSAEHYELCVWTNQDVAFQTVVLLSPPGRLIDKNHLTAAKRQHAAAQHEVLKTAKQSKQRIEIKIKCI